jgi:ATP-dependent DNA helicase RecQ
MLDYANNKSICREHVLLEYFGELTQESCGNCDICRNLNKNSFSKSKEDLTAAIKKMTLSDKLDIHKIVANFQTNDSQEVITAVKWLMENNYLLKIKNNYTWNTKEKS